VGGGEGRNSGLGRESDGRVVGRWFRGCRQSRTGGEPGGRGGGERVAGGEGVEEVVLVVCDWQVRGFIVRGRFL